MRFVDVNKRARSRARLYLAEHITVSGFIRQRCLLAARLTRLLDASGV